MNTRLMPNWNLSFCRRDPEVLIGFPAPHMWHTDRSSTLYRNGWKWPLRHTHSILTLHQCTDSGWANLCRVFFFPSLHPMPFISRDSFGFWTLLSSHPYSSFDPSLNLKSEGSLAPTFAQHSTHVSEPWLQKSDPKFKLCCHPYRKAANWALTERFLKLVSSQRAAENISSTFW